MRGRGPSRGGVGGYESKMSRTQFIWNASLSQFLKQFNESGINDTSEKVVPISVTVYCLLRNLFYFQILLSLEKLDVHHPLRL